MKKTRILILTIILVSLMVYFVATKIIVKPEVKRLPPIERTEFDRISERAKTYNDLESIQIYQTFIKRNPASPDLDDAWLEAAKAWINLPRGEWVGWEGAIFSLKSLIEEYPDSEHFCLAHFLIAWCYHEMGKSDYSDYDLDNDIAISKFKDIFQVQDDKFKRYKREDSYRLSIKKYKEFISLFPEDDLVDEALYNMARVYTIFNEFKKAEESYEKLIEEFPEGNLADDAFYRLAESSMIQGDYSNAITVGEKLINDYPKSDILPYAYAMVGYCYYLEKDYKKSEDTYRILLKKYPDSDLSEVIQEFNGSKFVK